MSRRDDPAGSSPSPVQGSEQRRVPLVPNGSLGIRRRAVQGRLCVTRLPLTRSRHRRWPQLRRKRVHRARWVCHRLSVPGRHGLRPPVPRSNSMSSRLLRPSPSNGFGRLVILTNSHRMYYDECVRVIAQESTPFLADKQGARAPVLPARCPEAAPEQASLCKSPVIRKQVRSRTGLCGRKEVMGPCLLQDAHGGSSGPAKLPTTRRPPMTTPDAHERSTDLTGATRQGGEESVAEADLSATAPLLPDDLATTASSADGGILRLRSRRLPRLRAVIDAHGVRPLQVNSE